jgi:hypothetical protein
MNQETLPQDLIDTIHSFMKDWSEEQLKDFQEASNTKNWDEYNRKYKIKDIFYKKFDTLEDCNLEGTIDVLKLSKEEADEYFDKKVTFREKEVIEN